MRRLPRGRHCGIGPERGYRQHEPSMPARARVTRDVLLTLASLNCASWNQLDGWLRQVEGLRQVA